MAPKNKDDDNDVGFRLFIPLCPWCDQPLEQLAEIWNTVENVADFAARLSTHETERHETCQRCENVILVKEIPTISFEAQRCFKVGCFKVDCYVADTKKPELELVRGGAAEEEAPVVDLFKGGSDNVE